MNIVSNREPRPNLAGASEAEWQTRTELAAAYRLMAHFGLGELAHNHICARVPGEPDAFLIKPMDLFYEEVTASNLIKYDFEGNPRQADKGALTGPGLVIHGGIFAARPDVQATLHSHATAIIGVSCQQHGLLPINQQAIPFMGRIGYLEYGGLDTELEQRGPMIESVRGMDVTLLRNHGALIVGRTIGGVMTDHYKLDLACKSQLAALAGGHPVVLIADEVVRKTQATISARPFYGDGGLNWKGMLRVADRLFPDHKA